MVALTAVSFSCEPDGVKEAGFSDQQHKAECGSRASITELWMSRQHYKGQCAASADKDSKTESLTTKTSDICCGDEKELLAPSKACALSYSKCGGAADSKKGQILGYHGIAKLSIS